MVKFTRQKRSIKSELSLETSEGSIPYILSRSQRRRSLSICINDRAEVGVFAPYNMKEAEIRDFVLDKSDWIVEKLKVAKEHLQIFEKKYFDHGGEFLFLGQKYHIFVEEGSVKRSRISFSDDGWRIVVPTGLTAAERKKHVKARLTGWYRAQAEEILGSRLFNWARIIKVEPLKVAIRTHKRIWGNCDYYTKAININWQIILAPMRVVDYVVAHELCHLIHPNHSTRFWKKVESFIPDYKKCKKWLKDHHFEMMLPL